MVGPAHWVTLEPLQLASIFRAYKVAPPVADLPGCSAEEAALSWGCVVFQDFKVAKVPRLR